MDRQKRTVAIGTASVHSSPLLRIAEIGGNILRDIEFHGAPYLEKLFFVNSNDLVAQWSNKLFLIAVHKSSVTSLPEVPGEKRIDASGKVLAVQQDGLVKLYTLPTLHETASLAAPSSALLRTAGEGRLLAFDKQPT